MITTVATKDVLAGMTTPPNPPHTPAGPPSEPSDEPARLSLQKPSAAQPAADRDAVPPAAEAAAPEPDEAGGPAEAAPPAPAAADATVTLQAAAAPAGEPQEAQEAPAAQEAPEPQDAPAPEAPAAPAPAASAAPVPAPADATVSLTATPPPAPGTGPAGAAAPPAAAPSFEKAPAAGPAGPPAPADVPPVPPAAHPAPAPVRSAFAPPTAEDLAAAQAAPYAAPAHGAPPYGAPPYGAPTHGGGPGVPQPPAPDVNPWTQPAPGTVPYAAYLPPAPAGNGLAVAAVVVASLGVFLGLVPLFFWIGGLLALVAIGLGIGGIVRASKGAPNRVMAIVGTALGGLGLVASVAGFFITVSVFENDGGYAHSIDYGDDPEDLYPGDEPWPTVSRSPSPSASQVPGLTSALPFGETFTYPNGVKVSLSAPTKYQPKGITARERIKNAIQLTVTITNGSKEPHEVIYAMPNVRDDKGMTADMVFDSGGSAGTTVPKMIRGSILPGETASGIVAFEVPEGTRSITADISAGTLLDDVKYAGPIG
ncbi:hypothetical protein AB0O42_15235 [Streptomyces sp. NPDC089922]|uniref:hypothetical protein n=1 Tax=Streptomyces sp. NPDC089922 TaxID=3155189 RepID=UPI0034351D0C